MDRDRVVRRALWFSAAFNLGGAVLFAFPSSAPGRLIGLPAPVPPIYRALLAMFVLLFAGAYAWLASQRIIHRPLVALSALGKAGAFSVIFAIWLLDQAPARSVVAGAGDLALAAIFTWWLLGARGAAADAAAGAAGSR